MRLLLATGFAATAALLVGAANLPAMAEARAGLAALIAGPTSERPLLADGGLSEAALLSLSAFEPSSTLTPVKLQPVVCEPEALARPVETRL